MKYIRIVLLFFISSELLNGLKIILTPKEKERILKMNRVKYHMENPKSKNIKISHYRSHYIPRWRAHNIERKLTTDDDKNEAQNQRFIDEYKYQVRKYKQNYSFLNHLNDVENDEIKLLNQSYIKLKTGIRHTKDILNEKFDDIFNNFIYLGRYSY